MLGRGSEEVLACAEAGVPVEVVPGISSSIAAPAAAGIPVTHRGLSTGFVVVSGHVVDDLSAVAATGLTVVVLMGVATLPRLVEEFVAAGRSATTPVAVIHRAFDPRQRVVVGTLADIQQQVVSAAITNPSVIVIGDVVGVIPQVAEPRCSRRDGRDPARPRQPRPAIGEATRALAATLEARRFGTIVRAAFLEHDEPSLAQVADGAGCATASAAPSSCRPS